MRSLTPNFWGRQIDAPHNDIISLYTMNKFCEKSPSKALVFGSLSVVEALSEAHMWPRSLKSTHLRNIDPKMCAMCGHLTEILLTRCVGQMCASLTLGVDETHQLSPRSQMVHTGPDVGTMVVRGRGARGGPSAAAEFICAHQVQNTRRGGAAKTSMGPTSALLLATSRYFSLLFATFRYFAPDLGRTSPLPTFICPL